VILKQCSLDSQENTFKNELKVLAKLRHLSKPIFHYPKLLSYKYNKSEGEFLMSYAGKDLNSTLDQLK